MIRTASSFAVVLLVACACAPVNEYEIRIDASALEDPASKAVAYGYKPGEDDYGELASVELRNGRATLSGVVDYVRIVQIDVLPAEDIYPLGRAEFVLEPGLTTVRFLADANEVEGGKYTQLALRFLARRPRIPRRRRREPRQVRRHGGDVGGRARGQPR